MDITNLSAIIIIIIIINIIAEYIIFDISAGLYYIITVRRAF